MNYFHSKIEYLINFMNTNNLRLKFGTSLIQRILVEIISYMQNIELPSIRQFFPNIYEENSYMQHDLNRIFEHVGNEKQPIGKSMFQFKIFTLNVSVRFSYQCYSFQKSLNYSSKCAKAQSGSLTIRVFYAKYTDMRKYPTGITKKKSDFCCI